MKSRSFWNLTNFSFAGLSYLLNLFCVHPPTNSYKRLGGLHTSIHFLHYDLEMRVGLALLICREMDWGSKEKIGLGTGTNGALCWPWLLKSSWIRSSSGVIGFLKNHPLFGYLPWTKTLWYYSFVNLDSISDLDFAKVK